MEGGLGLLLRAVYGLFFPQAHADIDWTRNYEALDKELQRIVPEAEVGRRLVDKLVKVWLKDGRESWVLVHVDVQSSKETGFPRRMYVYNYRIFDRYNREVISLAVLGDDDPDWRPDAYGYSRWGFSAGIRFPVVKLLDYAADWQALESNPNPFATVVLAHLKTLETRKDDESRRAWKVRLAKGLYERGFSAPDVRWLFRFIDWMMDLPKPVAIRFWQQMREFEEERRMPFITTPERLAREESYLEGIEVALNVKFGADGLKLLPEIRQIEDHLILRAVLHAIESAKSPEDLRPIWAEGKRPE